MIHNNISDDELLQQVRNQDPLATSSVENLLADRFAELLDSASYEMNQVLDEHSYESAKDLDAALVKAQRITEMLVEFGLEDLEQLNTLLTACNTFRDAVPA